jgi:hypothetical protein
MFISEGESPRFRPGIKASWFIQSGFAWNGEWLAGMEMDCLGLYLPGTPKGLGDAPVGMPGLCAADKPDMNCWGKG